MSRLVTSIAQVSLMLYGGICVAVALESCLVRGEICILSPATGVGALAVAALLPHRMDQRRVATKNGECSWPHLVLAWAVKSVVISLLVMTSLFLAFHC